jgi:hypothetical protein
MNQAINLSIAATSKRVDIANIVALTFFNNVELPPKSQLNVAMGWRDSELGGTGPAFLVGKKKIRLRLRQSRRFVGHGLSRLRLLSAKDPLACHRSISHLGQADLRRP